jgi:hypothetical protein
MRLETGDWRLETGNQRLEAGGRERAAFPQVSSLKPQVSSLNLPLAFTWAWAGPYGAMQLAHLGAEVIHVESKTRPDGARLVPIHPTGVTPSLNTVGYFNQWNQGTKSIALDLSKPEAARDREAARGHMRCGDPELRHWRDGTAGPEL